MAVSSSNALNTELKTEVATKAPAELKVRQPLFFRITYNDKIAYLLGTNHLFSAKILPDELHQIKATCSAYVAESSDAPEEELLEFKNDFLKLYGRRPDDSDWYAKLTPVEQNLTQSLFDIFLEQYYADYAPKVSVQDVRLAVVTDYANFVLRPLLADLFEEVLNEAASTDGTVEPAIAGSMDWELASSFDEVFSLEDHFLWNRLVAEDEGNLEQLQELLELAMSFANSAKEHEVLELDVTDIAELQTIWTRFRDGGHLTDFEFVQACEEEDVAENHKMLKRNIVIFGNMLRLINDKPAPLFMTVGVEHLICKHGLLMMLDDQNVKVELFDPDHNGVEMFKPYKYSTVYFAAQEKNAVKPLYFTAVNTTAANMAVSDNQLTAKNHQHAKATFFI